MESTEQEKQNQDSVITESQSTSSAATRITQEKQIRESVPTDSQSTHPTSKGTEIEDEWKAILVAATEAQKNPNHWHVTCHLDGNPVNLIVDTGCRRTLVHERVYRKLGDATLGDLRESDANLTGVTGTGLEVLGMKEMELELGGVSCRTNVEIVRMALDGILGLDALTQMNCGLDCGARRLVVAPDRPNVPTERGIDTQLYTVEETVLAPRTEQMVALCLDASSAQQGPSEGQIDPIEGGLARATRALVTVRDGRVISSLMNPGYEDQIIPAGTPIATFAEVDEIVQETQDNTWCLGKARQEPDTRQQFSAGGLAACLIQQGDAEAVAAVEKNEEFPEHLEVLLENPMETLTPAELATLKNLLKEFADIFMEPGGKLGRTNIVQHTIDTGDSKPIKQPLRRAPFKQQEIIEQEVEKMLEAGVVQPSDSPWSSPVVLVRKKDGSHRFCVDFRRLNRETRGDAYPLPRIDESFDTLSGNQFFSTLDLASGYWQVELDAESKPKTAFSTRSGLYEFNVMPFGLSTAPATFERLMEIAMRGIQWRKCLVYLDDIISVGKTFEGAIDSLRDVFTRLRQAGLRIKPSKCTLLKPEVEFLGHIVGREGLKCCPKKIQAVKEYEPPKNLHALRSFLGFVGYYRRFIKGFATIASPLTKLTQKDTPFQWRMEHQDAFDKLREPLLTEPLMAYPDPEKTYILDTDASGHGIGGVLSQVHDDGLEHVIAYASYTLRPTQRNYCTTKRELLAVVVMIHHFRHYVWGTKFRLRTDHASLKWLLKFKDAEGMIARWSARIASFDFDIEIREGAKHGNADGMSRCRQCKRDECPADGTSPRDKVFEDEDILPNLPAEEWNFCGAVLTAATECENVIPVLRANIRPSEQFLTDVTIEDMQQAQRDDPDIGPVMQWRGAAAEKPAWGEVRMRSQAVKTMWQQWDRLAIEDGLLIRHKQHPRKPQPRRQIVLPLNLRTKVFDQVHGNPVTSHMGVTRTVERVQEKFYWPGMKKDIIRWVGTCRPCQRTKPRPGPRRHPLGQIPVGAPFERIAMDILEPGTVTQKGNRYILVVADYFTRWVEAYALTDHTAYEVADKLMTEFISRFGVPHQIHSDQGREFESKLFRALAKMLGCTKTHTAPYRPQSDGLVERANRTILQLLTTMVNENRDDWDDCLPYVMSAYRSSVQETTGCSPNLMLFGRENAIPLHLMYPCTAEEYPPCSQEYVQWLRQTLQYVHNQAREKTKMNMARQKRNYDKTALEREFSPGTWVWYYYTPAAKKKMAMSWTGPYLVINNKYGHAVQIQQNPDSPIKSVHIDHLKPLLGDPPRESWIQQDTEEGGDPPPHATQTRNDYMPENENRPEDDDNRNENRTPVESEVENEENDTSKFSQRDERQSEKGGNLPPPHIERTEPRPSTSTDPTADPPGTKPIESPLPQRPKREIRRPRRYQD